jgi:pimeloyl-ACP methyl ester carboxylesterase
MPFVWSGIAIFALCAVVLAIAYYTYCVAFRSPKNRKENVYDIPDDDQYNAGRAVMISAIDKMMALPFEEVEIISRDGLKLYGRYYHVRDEAPLQIQFHGWRGTAYRDFCGGHALARLLGHNTLVVDQRAHGKSEGHTISFGIKERFDCLDWIAYAQKRFGEEKTIYLAGVSMGAATVLMASGLPLPNAVKGVIADSPYSSPEKIIEKVCREMGFPPKLAMPFLRLGARVFGGFSLKEAGVADSVRFAKVPALIIHGEDDRFVPCQMSEEVFNAYAGEKYRITFEGAGHGLSYIVDEEKYERVTVDFLRAIGEDTDDEFLARRRKGEGK